jgi:hypothetical protein
MSDPETFAEQIERLELMAEGDPQWNLSDNDRAAIHALLENYRECVGESIRRSR